MKVALVHYWLLHMRGGEKVLEAIGELFPEADIFAHVVRPEGLSDSLRRHRLSTTFIQRLPRSHKMYQSYLPLMPWALDSLDLREYDLVISSESGPAKGVVVRPDALHVCYCHSPMRYVWDMAPDYASQAGGLKRFFLNALLPTLRLWDRLTADRVDAFVANSAFVASRIRSYYRRSSAVIHPPVDVEGFVPTDSPTRDYHLLLGQLVPYKRADLAVEAFTRTGKRLVVVGEGEQLQHLRKISGPNVEFLGRQPSDRILSLYQNCRALVFPGVEDFGIVPVEAQACGRPVVAFGRGGALETVIDGKTGILFAEQTVEGLIRAIEDLEASDHRFDPAAIRSHAQTFAREVFDRRFRGFVEEAMAAKRSGASWAA